VSNLTFLAFGQRVKRSYLKKIIGCNSLRFVFSTDTVFLQVVVVFDTERLTQYNYDMIKSFKDNAAEKIFQRQYSRKLPHDTQRTALRKLRIVTSSPS